jgi:hypothetical protein
MRRLTGVCGLMLGIAMAVSGCGSAGTGTNGEDQLTMSFQRFTGEGITQADVVADTSAQVDICQGLCVTDQDVNLEDFTSTLVRAVFVNRGKADIFLDTYTLFVPGSGVPEARRSISANLPGGRCLGASQTKCAVNDECGVGLCQHSESSLTVLLYDFDFKQRLIQGQCPTLDDPQSTVQTQTLNAELTFSGTDETGERFTISTNYVSIFDNFDNCPEE